MDWLIEGQLEKERVTTQEAEIVSSYEELVVENTEPSKPIYDKFITGNKYSIGDYKITIDSEEGQILNGMLIEQRDLQTKKVLSIKLDTMIDSLMDMSKLQKLVRSNW